MIMESQLCAELELAHDKLYVSRNSLYTLLNALAGISSNATQCGACRMGAEIADEALNQFEHATGITREMAYRWGKLTPHPHSDTAP
jgi:hypothetical protein